MEIGNHAFFIWALTPLAVNLVGLVMGKLAAFFFAAAVGLAVGSLFIRRGLQSCLQYPSAYSVLFGYYPKTLNPYVYLL